MEKESCLFLGTLQKPHGVAGGMVLRSPNVLPENLDETDHVFLNIDEILVPFFVGGFTYRDDKTGIIFLDDVDDKAKTTEFIHREVYLPDAKPQPGEKDHQLDYLVGYHLLDITSGFTGIISAVDDIPGNPVMHVKTNDEEVLIPFQQDLIKRVNKKKKTMEMNLPDGLLDLYGV